MSPAKVSTLDTVIYTVIKMYEKPQKRHNVFLAHYTHAHTHKT